MADKGLKEEAKESYKKALDIATKIGDRLLATLSRNSLRRLDAPSPTPTPGPSPTPSPTPTP